MQKYRADRMNLLLLVDNSFPPMENHRDVYLASEVDARIAELERKKRLLWDRLQVIDEQLLDVLPHWRGTTSHELIVDLLTECRTS